MLHPVIKLLMSLLPFIFLLTNGRLRMIIKVLLKILYRLHHICLSFWIQRQYDSCQSVSIGHCLLGYRQLGARCPCKWFCPNLTATIEPTRTCLDNRQCSDQPCKRRIIFKFMVYNQSGSTLPLLFYSFPLLLLSWFPVLSLTNTISDTPFLFILSQSSPIYHFPLFLYFNLSSSRGMQTDPLPRPQ